MKAAPTLAVLLAALAPVLGRTAEEPAPKSSVRETLRARIAADARKAPTPAPAAPTAKVEPTSAKTETALPAAAPTAPPAETAASAPAEPDKTEPAMMPKVEVRKEKYSARDHKLAYDLLHQDQAIARERKNLTVSETDLALNDAKIAKPLAIFGGDSAQFRQRVAAERVELLEAEKDIIEQIAIAQKPEEKKNLQHQLDELRAMRRQLDTALR